MVKKVRRAKLWRLEQYIWYEQRSYKAAMLNLRLRDNAGRMEYSLDNSDILSTPLTERCKA